MHEHARLFRKEGNVGVEEIGAEPEDDHSGFGQLDGEGIFDAPVIGSPNQNAGLGAVTAAYMLEERENDGKDDALLDAKNDDGGAVTRARANSLGWAR